MKSEHAQPGHDIPPDMQVLVTADTKNIPRGRLQLYPQQGQPADLTAKEAIQEGYVPCVRCLRKYLNVAAGRYAPQDEETAEEQAAEEQELRQAGH